MKTPLYLPALLLVALALNPFAVAQLPASGRTSIQFASVSAANLNGAVATDNGATTASSKDRLPAPTAMVTIPGPLRSFLRMAGISQKASTEEILPLFARNVYVQGYVGWRDKAAPTEFLILVGRYMNQAKELQELAGPSGTIHLSKCEEAVPLLRVLGYRMRDECGGKDVSLVTSDPERAFLTTDSGFPLLALEDALQTNKEFSYTYPQSQIPVLFTEQEWKDAIKTNRRDSSRDLIELFIHHPAASRLYWALSRTDAETRTYLEQKIGLQSLISYSAEFDYYGTQIRIRSGNVEVPGGPAADPAWKDLVGASPASPADFVTKLLSKDKGWLATYFDCLARVNQEQQQHFVDARRLKTLYLAFRGQSANSDAARPAFRLAPGLLLLITRMQWDANGEPQVPGGLDLWKELLREKSDHAVVRSWGKHDGDWNSPEQLLQALFAFSRLETDDTPLQMYLLFTELDGRRPADRQLKTETLRLMAKHFQDYSDQYEIFSEFPTLDDGSIASFISSANAVSRIPSHTLRGNAMGTFQAVVGLWQILARQQEIPRAELNASFREAVESFAKVSSPAELVDVAASSLRGEFHAATGKQRISQGEIIELLAGPHQSDPDAQRIHQEMARGIRNVMDGQRLVSLDALLGLRDGLADPGRAAEERQSLLPLVGELREFQMPRAIFTSTERSEWAAGIYNNHHTDLQMQTDIPKLLKSSPTRAQIDEARGELAPFFRDTLVGLNYAYYEPPGAQLLRTDPLFVRSHDFAGETVEGVEGLWHAPQLFGAGVSAGGGAHLVGSLADLPYVLSEAEQDFIVPENVQALIWRETVPGLLTSAVLPRWWNVSKNELHAVTLYQRAGEELVSESSSNEQVRARVITILSDRLPSEEISALELDLTRGHAEHALEKLTPTDTSFLIEEYRRLFPDDADSNRPAAHELALLAQQSPADVSWERISRDFGIPHPIMKQTYTTELLNQKPFPAFSGYCSRLMAESWDSNNLYWARLLDERGSSPTMLNRLAPELTRDMVAKIFATDFEDRQALLRALRETGDDFREGKVGVGSEARASAKSF